MLALSESARALKSLMSVRARLACDGLRCSVLKSCCVKLENRPPPPVALGAVGVGGASVVGVLCPALSLLTLILAVDFAAPRPPTKLIWRGIGALLGVDFVVRIDGGFG